MRILLASDHGGFKLKSYLIKYLKSLGIFEIEDFGPHELNPDDDYPDFILPLVKKLQTDTKNQKAVILCRNGVGVCVAANKFKGARASLVSQPEQAKTARTDDNANVLCLPADFIKEESSLELLNTWLGTEFSWETRHLRRLNKISHLGTGQPSDTIFPSIFEETLSEITSKIKLAQKYFEIIQVDFADGKLVDGKTYLDMYELGKIKTTAKLEMHLMLDNPLIALNNKINNVVKVCAQVEGQNIEDFIKKSKSLGYLVGLSLDANSKLTLLEKYLEQIDYVQFMTVRAGAKGRDFDKSVLKKIVEFKQLHPNMTVQVDGHVNTDTIKEVLLSGADFVAPNTALFDGNIESNLKNLIEAIN